MIGRLLCRLGLHLPANGRVGPCQRGCGHITERWSNGRMWERHVERPTGQRPSAPPPPPPPKRSPGEIARKSPERVEIHIYHHHCGRGHDG